MYSLIKKALVALSDIEQIFAATNKLPRRKLFWDYLRLRTKASLNRWFHFKHEKFLQFEVEFPDYEIFFTTFRQVFIRNAYFFKSDNESPRIIDAGGNIGMATLYFKTLYPNALITVFEPSHETGAFIERNFNKNKLSGITLLKKAVGDTEGVTTMYSRGAAACGNTLVKTLQDDVNSKSSGDSYEISVTKLSSYITHELDFLKMDIEGAEGSVLRELEQNNVLKHIKTLILEYHHGTNLEVNKLSRIIDILERAGWVVEPFSEDPLTSYSLSLRTR